ncbi:unnamed protein product [Litomosoides sigmodontis]|uniref:Uncharacterized protein n=1 Tax=Litomosoides sigmodontis TaxID=42156 RepID=A0A3P7K4H4_LITSI|nr:unnamed protein product [Litomosoides sigmodontis]
MEPHPYCISATSSFSIVLNPGTDIIPESTTLYYSLAPISYATYVTSSIPYQNTTVSQNNVSEEQFSPFSTDIYLNQSISSSNEEALNDHCPWNRRNESTEMFNFPLRNADDSHSQASVATERQQSPLSSDLQPNAELQPLPLSSFVTQANITSQHLSPSFKLQRRRTSQQLMLSSVEQPQANSMSQPLPRSSIIQTNITAQQLRLSSNSRPRGNVVLRRLPISSNLQAAQSPQSGKFSQTSNGFKCNLPLIHKMRMLHDRATRHARLAQDSWEEAGEIAAYLNVPPPPLPDAIDFMTHSYLKYQKQWNLTKNVDEQENIKPRLPKIVRAKNFTSLSDLQSNSRRTKPSSNANSPSNSNFNQLPLKMSGMEKSVHVYTTSANFQANRSEEMLNQQLPATSLELDDHRVKDLSYADENC